MTPPVQPGEILADKYRIERVLGRGGMGVVVAATHLELLELRAIKYMLPEHASQPIAVERFLREARAAARLRSEHIAKVYDVGRFPDGAPFMVMEYLEGIDLSTHLKQRGPLPIADVATVGLQVCEALAEAHGLGIVHRDLKPANLFLTRRADGSPLVKVLDFGISKLVAQDVEVTTTFAVLGSPTYMSPEQMRSSRSVDVRADLWSLGVILYRLLTGKVPFEGDNVAELISAVLSTAPTPPSQHRAELPPQLDAIVLRCLERDPSLRYPSALELARDLAPLAPPHVSAAFDRLGIASAAAGPPITITSSLSARVIPLSQRTPSGPAAALAGAAASTADASSIDDASPTHASWGRSGRRAEDEQRTSRRALGIVAIGACVLAILGVMLFMRSQSPAVAPASDASSVTAASAPALEPSVVVTATASAEPSAVASAAASATASAVPSAAASPAEITSAPEPKIVEPAAHVVVPRAPADPFGRARK